MVPKKTQSKRLPASHQYKLKKKVANHHKKQKKEAKKLGLTKPKKSLKKDPGIPNLFPLKEKILQQAQAAKDAMKEERKAKTSSSADLKQPKLGSLQDLVASASARSNVFESMNTQPSAFQSAHLKESVLADKDNSRKAYYKEFKKVVEAADVILEILDARDPLGCRTRQIEELILNSGLNKRIILLLNKIDLVPRENAEAWLKYLRNEFPTIAFKASTQTQRSHLSQSNISVNIAPENLLNSSECLGADNLMKLLKNYCRNNKIKTSITVGVVGYPNVGKSSVINSLKRAKVCQVGSTPGVTKVSQLIHLDKNIKLLDCPGIVFGKSATEDDDANVILRNCVKIELIDDPIAPVEKIVERCDRAQLIKIYNAPFFTQTKDFLLHIAMSRGKLKRGGIPDLENAARSLLQDWNNGRIPYYTVPPSNGVAVESHLSAQIVQSWAQEFSLPEIVSIEGKELASVVRGKSEISHSLLVMKNGKSPDVDMDIEEKDDAMSDA